MINTLRNEIDRIDHEMLALFRKRIACVESIGRFKKENNLPVKDEARENQIREALETRLSDEPHRMALAELMENIMAISRDIQHQMGTQERPMAGFQGTEGAYSEEAIIHHFGADCPRRSYQTFEEVFTAVASGQVTYGMVPIENSSTGGIREVYDLLLKYGLYIVGEQALKVRHHLIGLPGTSVDEITEVYSHPQGIEQCSRFLSYYPEWKKISYLNTASSVRHVSENGDKRKAAIGSGRAAEIYGLEILKDGIQDNLMNTTRFIVLGRDEKQDVHADKISLIFQTAHTAGALFEVLAIFAQHGINMVKIESRPDKRHPGQYVFYVDIEGHMAEERVRKAIGLISAKQKFFRVLGSYRRSK